MASKRPLVFDDVSDISSTSPNAKVQGVVTALSPMKKTRTCSFFDGRISDEKASLRVFGFDSSVRKKLLDFEEGKQAVCLSNCEIKRSRQGNDLEILVTRYTDFRKSDKQFDVSSANSDVLTELKALQDLVAFQRVAVEVKVLQVDDPLEVSGGKRKQDLRVGDSSGTARVTVWEQEIGTMEEGRSYKMSGMMVREFRGKKFLSTSKDNCHIENIDDIGDVEEEMSENEGTSVQDQPLDSECRVVGVVYLDRYSSCLKCAAKVIPDEEDPELGECARCKMMQVLEECDSQLSTQLMIKGDNNSIWTLRAFGKVVEDIAQQPAGKITKGMLIKAKPFTATHRDGVI